MALVFGGSSAQQKRHLREIVGFNTPSFQKIIEAAEAAIKRLKLGKPKLSFGLARYSPPDKKMEKFATDFFGRGNSRTIWPKFESKRSIKEEPKLKLKFGKKKGLGLKL